MDPFTLLHLANWALPTDGFAHTAGLVAAVRLGHVHDADGLLAFVEEALWATGGFSLPFVRAARCDPGALPVLDACCDAAMPSSIVNRTSREQGQAFLQAAAAISPATARLADAARRSRTPGHLAPAFGAVLGSLGATSDDAARLFLFLCARGIVSEAARLRTVGDVEAQALLARAAPAMRAVFDACRSDDPRDAAGLSEAIDLLRSQQDRLFAGRYVS
jgi:urease accessory protein